MARGPILVTGSTGQVGGALARLLGPRADVLTPGRAELDLSSPESIRAYVRQHRPVWILNPAAYTQVDRAESEVEHAERINAIAPGVLGEVANEVGAVVIHFSTDYVFSGKGERPWREDDATAPQNVYGATKLAGEQALAASGAAHIIFRTSWVYAAKGKNFPLTILRVAREREEMKIVADQIGAPTLADDLAMLTLHAITKAEETGDAVAAVRERLGGVYHACDSGETSWHGFATEVVRLAAEREPGVRFARLLPIPTEEYPTPAARPLNSRMDCTRLQRCLGFDMPLWQESAAQFIEQYYQEPRSL